MGLLNFIRRAWRRFHEWGVTDDETRLEYPCDAFQSLSTVYYRGVTIDAGPEAIFAWLCQMRVAPYSYDWLDNFGRRSPHELMPGLTGLEIGQVFMSGFHLVSFSLNSQVTIRSRDIPWWQFVFGDIVVSYVIKPIAAQRSRLLVKLRLAYPTSVVRPLMKLVLPPGDAFMMRKQLLTFKRLAERSPSTSASDRAREYKAGRP